MGEGVGRGGEVRCGENGGRYGGEKRWGKKWESFKEVVIHKKGLGGLKWKAII